MFLLRTVCSRSLPAARRVEEAIEKEACALHTTVSRRADKDPKAEETAKKYVGKIHEEEANKEKHPSPVSPAAQEKLTEMERKAQEHDQKKKQK